MLSNVSTTSFALYPSLLGRVARYTPSSELDIQTKI